MTNPFYEQDMDIKEYINKRILEIDSLSDRILYKEMVESFMINLFEIQRDEREKLTNKVLNEVSLANQSYNISIGMIERSKFNGTDSFLFPIIKDKISQDMLFEINEALQNNTMFFIENIFLKDFYINLSIFSNQKYFKGTINTTEGEYTAKFSVVPDIRYIKKLKELFEAFRNNGIKWNTINLAYIIRTYAVSIESIESTKLKGTYLGYSIDFGEYESKIVKDVMPLWNIEIFSEKTNSFPICVDEGLKYKHSILLDKKQHCSKIIVGDLKSDLYSIYSKDNQISIVSTEREPKEWLIYEIKENLKQESYYFPVLSNNKQESLTSNLREKYQCMMSTKAEIIRLIEESPFVKEISLIDIKISNIISKELVVYNMNSIFSDDIINITDKKTLTLILKSNVENDYLIYDYMSFIATNIGEVLREYIVIAELEN